MMMGMSQMSGMLAMLRLLGMSEQTQPLADLNDDGNFWIGGNVKKFHHYLS